MGRWERPLMAIGTGMALLVLFGVLVRLLKPESLRERLESNRACRLCDLSGADLRDGDLRSVDLTGADLRGATLNGADFTGANLEGASFVKANLVNASFDKANLDGVNFRQARGRPVQVDAYPED